MAAVGVDVRTMNTEYGAGQLEITFSPHWGIAACDAASTFKTGVKEIAQQRGARGEPGMVASFQSKPFSMTGPGNGTSAVAAFPPSAGGAGADAADREHRTSLARSLARSLEGGHFNFSLWRAPDRTPAVRDDGRASGLSEIAEHFIAGVLAHAPALEAFCSPTPACYCRCVPGDEIGLTGRERLRAIDRPVANQMLT